jgi:hypothetical protein
VDESDSNSCREYHKKLIVTWDSVEECKLGIGTEGIVVTRISFVKASVWGLTPSSEIIEYFMGTSLPIQGKVDICI